MKKSLLTLSLLTSLSLWGEGITKRVATTEANSLKTQLPMPEWGTITNLIVSGPIGESDIRFISNVAKATNNLQILDLSESSEINELPKSAFAGIKSLTSISLPSSLIIVSEKAFMDCSNLTDVVFNEGLTTISDRAFCNDSLLSSIELPSTLEDFNISALDGCNSLEEIKVKDENQTYYSNFGVLYTTNSSTIIKYPSSKSDDFFVIPDGITSIGNKAFYNCSKLKFIDIPPSVQTIGKNAFSNCTGFKSLNIGEGVTKIEDFAFTGCSNLETISFPKKLKTIGDAMFTRCCKINNIRCEAPIPPSFSPLVESPFVSNDKSSCTLNTSNCLLSIPSSSRAKYIEAKGWDAFTNLGDVSQNQ